MQVSEESQTAALRKNTRIGAQWRQSLNRRGRGRQIENWNGWSHALYRPPGEKTTILILAANNWLYYRK